jgi:hypothetical protein
MAVPSFFSSAKGEEDFFSLSFFVTFVPFAEKGGFVVSDTVRVSEMRGTREVVRHGSLVTNASFQEIQCPVHFVQKVIPVGGVQPLRVAQ